MLPDVREAFVDQKYFGASAPANLGTKPSSDRQPVDTAAKYHDPHGRRSEQLQILHVGDLAPYDPDVSVDDISKLSLRSGSGLSGKARSLSRGHGRV